MARRMARANNPASNWNKWAPLAVGLSAGAAALALSGCGSATEAAPPSSAPFTAPGPASPQPDGPDCLNGYEIIEKTQTPLDATTLQQLLGSDKTASGAAMESIITTFQRVLLKDGLGTRGLNIVVDTDVNATGAAATAAFDEARTLQTATITALAAQQLNTPVAGEISDVPVAGHADAAGYINILATDVNQPCGASASTSSPPPTSSPPASPAVPLLLPTAGNP